MSGLVGQDRGTLLDVQAHLEAIGHPLGQVLRLWEGAGETSTGVARNDVNWGIRLSEKTAGRAQEVGHLRR